MNINLASNLQTDSIIDGEGIRTVIWTQGCAHNCKGCHNPQTHDFNKGFKVDINEIKKQIDNLKNQDGITLSGGDPFYQVEAVNEIARYCRSKDLNVWCYTGFTFEELLEMSKNNLKLLELLQNIDVLVDGQFILEQKSFNLQFKGSRNQRVLDVNKSLIENKPIEIEKYKNERIYKAYNYNQNKNNGLYI